MEGSESLSSWLLSTGGCGLQSSCVVYFVCFHSDQMGNKGAYVTLTRDLRPQFTTYEAVVSYTLHHHYIILIYPLPPPASSQV